MKQSQQFFAEYVQLYRPLLNRLNNLLAPYQLFHSQWGILKLLWIEGEMTSAEIAVRRQVEKPSVTKIVQRLLEMGLVSVRPGTDRREKWIGLTEQGQATVSNIIAGLEEFYENLLEGATEEDLEAGIHILKQANKNLHK
ncbi:MarR family transcriptional regulator [Sporosarcina sp. P21c]|uniref:MarR family winged helix-turn-helix transcriptional regulator n=1 Tax=unclassified Sporosarcina TaxID=2647733 RepID=UPI000C164114|nr:MULTISPECIES: MarR family transcriptional regulator [unclassified Sporosarcina]PIC68279.1 MarR family transcriptional regulator [Sporosarcina sp. P16a]PIC84103.1 MarR family transcriptional regulator [Sporosarcina sp. P1]PIC90489.1 MarR family transcriptional regulator [Sporosarcina sp. P21c]PIC94020.1 MarR family transcriptional regulator [Sporosarcina sp. P25]